VLDEPALARHLCAALPAGTTLVVSSSMPIRDVESYGGRRHAPLRVVANRGANGIDGVVSTAFGVALATGGPTVALVGDLAFLHDVSALVRVPADGLRCTVVVADNGGGGIFSFLPQADALEPAAFEQLFGTPQLPDVGAVAGGFGIPVTEVGTVEELVGALGGGTPGGGVRVVRVRLPSRVANVERHGAVNDAIAAAVTATVRTG
jgi:2-succinyl-5-enolpyruvyl-6-hydroxy-3-cyclohexene-1-carboxylate synthase